MGHKATGWRNVVAPVIIVMGMLLPLARPAQAASPGRDTAAIKSAVMLVPRAARQEQHRTLTAYAAGQSIWVRASHLPRPTIALCVGLASLIDQGSLPLNLGRLHATSRSEGELRTRIPTGLIGPEPAGPYLLFVGKCATPAPTGEYARTVIAIHA